MKAAIALIVIAMIVIVMIAGAVLLLRRRRAKPALPVRVERECGTRLDSGLPIGLWLIISNDADASQPIKLSIEYVGGREMVENLSIASGQLWHRIPEPHRVQRIRISAVGYKGMVVYV